MGISAQKQTFQSIPNEYQPNGHYLGIHELYQRRQPFLFKDNNNGIEISTPIPTEIQHLPERRLITVSNDIIKKGYMHSLYLDDITEAEPHKDPRYLSLIHIVSMLSRRNDISFTLENTNGHPYFRISMNVANKKYVWEVSFGYDESGRVKGRLIKEDLTTVDRMHFDIPYLVYHGLSMSNFINRLYTMIHIQMLFDNVKPAQYHVKKIDNDYLIIGVTGSHTEIWIYGFPYTNTIKQNQRNMQSLLISELDLPRQIKALEKLDNGYGDILYFLDKKGKDYDYAISLIRSNKINTGIALRLQGRFTFNNDVPIFNGLSELFEDGEMIGTSKNGNLTMAKLMEHDKDLYLKIRDRYRLESKLREADDLREVYMKHFAFLKHWSENHLPLRFDYLDIHVGLTEITLTIRNSKLIIKKTIPFKTFEDMVRQHEQDPFDRLRYEPFGISLDNITIR